MSRRIALALSFSLTVVVSFAVMSFASQAGWLETKPAAGSDDATLVDEPVDPMAAPTEAVQVEPIVITEYVYGDAPARTEAPPAATPAPSPTSQPAGVVVQPAASTASTSASAPPQTPPPTKAPATTRGRTASDHDDDEDEDEHDDDHDDRDDEHEEDDD